jgi:integrase
VASLVRSADGKDVRILFTLGGKRKTLRPGREFVKHAETIKGHVEAIVAADDMGEPVARATAAWRTTCGHKLRRKLVKLGLAPPTTDETAAKERAAAERARPVTVAAFVDDYLGKREGTVKWRTMNGAQQDRDSLVAFLGTDRTLASVTAGDADDFLMWLRREGRRGRKGSAAAPRGSAEATIGRRIRRCSQFFRAAVRKKLIAENPFAGGPGGIKAPSQENKARFYFVSREKTDKVLAACPDGEWRLIVALARYGGLRTPSETLALKWGDVDWDQGRVRVRSPKTEHVEGKGERIIPLFPELRTHLQAAWDALGDEPADFIVTRCRDGSVNLRTGLQRIIRRAGLTPWPRLFHNLRASRQNELTKSFPLHVACEWIGNSALIADKHYLEVTEDYFAAAAETGARSGADNAGQERTGADTPLGMSAPVLCGPLGTGESYPQGDWNRGQKSRENKGLGGRPDKPAHDPHTCSELRQRIAAVLAACPKLNPADCEDLAARVADAIAGG